jgi:plasmid stability protein
MLSLSTNRTHYGAYTMATLTVRNLDDEVRNKLRVRAAKAGRSMEDEVRVILRGAVMTGDPAAVWSVARAHFSGDDGVDLELPTREFERPVPSF